MSDSISERVRHRWTELENDWQAVCVGLSVVVIVSFGITIPW
ncbi:hypothetical protein [Haladaptatus sp.]